MLANIGWPGLLIILLIVVFLFGGRRIAEVAKGLGSGLKNFKQALKEDSTEETKTTDTLQETKIEKPEETTKKTTDKV
ncbi:MAG: twin-arginine translocase TatA/TatE family subunit [Campylobacteraceae bacterium]|jgi:sec-independent protein translocase protein TatA|nr:twin-arginine translocase TatA/TatE family subunit [Campylobacteraceae bacterium]